MNLIQTENVFTLTSKAVLSKAKLTDCRWIARALTESSPLTGMPGGHLRGSKALVASPPTAHGLLSFSVHFIVNCNAHEFCFSSSRNGLNELLSAL